MEKKTAVLLMPFRDDDAEMLLLRDELKEAASELGINLEEVRFRFNPEPVEKTIHRAIETAALTVAIIDGWNADLFYEAGYAKGIGQRVLLVAKSGATVPFSLHGYEHVEYVGGYVNREADKSRFVAALRKLTDAITESPVKEDLIRLRRALERLDLGTRLPLFRRCALWNLKEFIKWAETWHGRLEYRGKQQVLEIGTFILKVLETSGFATLYYPGEESWRADEDPGTNDEYLLVAREACKSGRISLTRVFVVTQLKDISDPAFRNLTFDDLCSGIDARYILETNLPAQAPRDFAIWDNELFCEVTYSSSQTKPEILKCTYSQDPFDLERAREWQRTILDRSERCNGLPPEQLLLAQSYEIQEEMASRHRGSGYVDADDASWYYASWQYLRMCNVVSCPNWHKEFYSSKIEQWLTSFLKKSTDARILITGLADYGMLYHLLATIGPQRLKQCWFEVIDLSQIPLEMCRWLETTLRDESRGRLDLKLETRVEDLLSNESAEGAYDLIVSDAFLTRFESNGLKVDAVRAWARLLSPSGQILTTARIRDTRDGRLTTEAQEVRGRFIERAVKNWPGESTPERLDRVKSQAKQYAEKITSFPFISASRAQDFFRGVPEIELVEFQQAVTPGEFYRTPYARVVLKKGDRNK